MKEQEVQMIDGLKAGEERSYNLLFISYYRPLSLFANKYLNDLDLAREIVQALFVHLFEIRDSLIITSSLKSYLFQSVRNRCLNHLKHIQLEEKHLSHMQIAEDTGTELEDKIAEAELAQRIFQYITELPDQCKRIFLMSRAEGKKNKEIAALLEISKRTVETQISRALKILREKLDDSVHND